MKKLPFPSVTWSNNNNPSADAACLGALRKYIVGQAQVARDWYQKRGPIRWVTSRIMVFSTIAATAAAGIIPLFPNPPLKPYWTSIFVAVAAALVLIDSSLTLSSSWTRCMLSQQRIDRVIEEYQFDWEVIRAGWGQTGPNSQQIADALERLKQAALQLLQIVEDETSAGAVELRADLRNAAEVKPQISISAGANVILTNSDQVQDNWSLEVDGRSFGKYAGGRAALVGLRPGAHQFRVEGTIGGQLQRDEVCAQMSATGVADIELTLAPKPA